MATIAWLFLHICTGAFLAFQFMMATFRRTSRPLALRLIHMSTFAVPRPTMWVAGVAKGRLSLEVIKFSRNLLFFFGVFPEPSPSTSATGRTRFRDCRDAGVVVAAVNVSLGRIEVPKKKICRQGNDKRVAIHESCPPVPRYRLYHDIRIRCEERGGNWMIK